MYKVIFNNNEVLIEARKLNKQMIVQKKKITNKNKSEMNIVADDVLDCMKKAKEFYLEKYNTSAKSIEVMKTSTSFVDKLYYNDIYNSQKEVA